MRTNERFRGFALFDIRHDFIKHSSNVQTLYIELYSRTLPSPIWTSPTGFAPASTNIVHPGGRLCIAKWRHTMRISYRWSIVTPQYRIMYNYITDVGGRGGWEAWRRTGWAGMGRNWFAVIVRA